MPKDRRSSSLDRCRASPYSRSDTNANRRRPKSPSRPVGNENQWEETRCPICMEHPHNAVLLLCSSREKGCLPYMCDTSARHSNCLDQFRKSTKNPNPLLLSIERDRTKLMCPLCRGQINGWIVVNPARNFFNKKPRSCSLGTCDFSGNYSELRAHARREHPRVKPTDINPEQVLEWRNLEEEIEQQEMLSMQFEFNNNNLNIDADAAEADADEMMHMAMDDHHHHQTRLDSPIWDHDVDFLNFLTTFESEFDNIFPEIDWDSEDLLDDFGNIFEFSPSSSSSHVLENNRESVSRSRGTSNRRPTTRSRTNANRRQRGMTTRGSVHDVNADLP